jgi:hypothetical protein
VLLNDESEVDYYWFVKISSDKLQKLPQLVS